MKHLLEAINRGILKGLNEQNIELLADLDDENLDQLDTIQTKSVNNKIDGYAQSIKLQLINAIRTGKISESLKEIINNPINFHTYKGIIKANDDDNLKELIWVGQKLFGADGNFNWIDTSDITDMSDLFYENKTFNGHIELWDVSNVTTMEDMFLYATKFNQPIGDWDVSRVTSMAQMFFGARSFNQPIGDWDVSNVTDMACMFLSAEKFNQPLNNWAVSDSANINFVFTDCPIKEKYKPKRLKN